MINEDFVAFILTHSRANNVKTTNALRNCGYTGKIIYVIDDEDKQRQNYIDNFGVDNVKIFSKKEIGKTFDRGDNFGKMGVIIYARNACFEIAKEMGVKYFIELDDDYTSFTFRYNGNLEYQERRIKDLDRTLNTLLEFFKNTDCLTIAMTQGGDYVGGGTGYAKSIRAKRKAMNSFICSTDRPFKFVGSINEDVNMYVTQGMTGKKVLQMPIVCLHQMQTQKNAGGMTETYLDSGTYVKSFYSVMYEPSCVKINLMGNTDRRIHHKVNWNNCCPKILDESVKKK